jgi:hypothetical protein
VLRRFKGGAAPVFVISLTAGGLGLNLTEAGYCFLRDPWWNPGTEAQAVGRAHRIGQTRNVMVYRLVASGTIEEKVMALKAKKAELFSTVMDEGNVFGARLKADDICGLFASAVVAAWGSRRRGIAGSGGIHLTGLAQLKGGHGQVWSGTSRPVTSTNDIHPLKLARLYG